MDIVILDADTLGRDIALDSIKNLGTLSLYATTSPQEVISRIDGATVVITNKVVIDRKTMESSPALKLICVSATGMNNIDLQAASELGITVKNVAGYSTPSVVQHTFTLLLYAMGHIAYYDEYVRSGRWIQSPIFTNLDIPYSEIAGKKWGIIGLGEIGRSVAKVASAFGAEVSYCSTSGIAREEGYPMRSLEALLQDSDIISIHAPLNEKTKNLLNSQNLSLIKTGAYLLNLGRGGIVNEYDLARFLQEGRFYALLDVLESEPMREDSPLAACKSLKNCIITPHIAWGGKESRMRLIEGVAKNIKDFLAERPR